MTWASMVGPPIIKSNFISSSIVVGRVCFDLELEFDQIAQLTLDGVPVQDLIRSLWRARQYQVVRLERHELGDIGNDLGDLKINCQPIFLVPSTVDGATLLLLTPNNKLAVDWDCLSSPLTRHVS